MSTTTHYVVDGMTCDHCVNAVSEEVGRISGVAGTDVDLSTGDLTVTSDHTPDQDAVRAAVEEAGYRLVTD